MGINHLNLNPELIAALYPESLVDSNRPESGQITVKTKASLLAREPVYPFLGKNLRSVCFWVSYPDDEFIPDDQLVFLQKILAACKYSLDDISLVNVKSNPVILEALKKQFSPRILFLWGAVPAITGINGGWPDMEISIWENVSVIPVLQAGQMGRDNPEAVALKRRLWISLQKLFSL